MRQVGAIPNESDAQRFAAHLVAVGVDAHAEHERDTWAIWVRDENQLDEAKVELAQFLENPAHARYQDAERAAGERRRREESERAKAKGNVVEMRGRWGRGAGARRAPLTVALILLSVSVSIVSGTAFEHQATGGGDWRNPVRNQLLFANMTSDTDPNAPSAEAGWSQIMRGQLWRTITPIFIHFGVMHLIFNMFALYYYGAQVEDRRGTLRYALLVVLIAVASNIAQYVVEGNPYFGGMSGVGYGLFGFVWMRMLYDPKSGLGVSTVNTVIMIAWFMLCVAREFGPFQEALANTVPRVANTAHGVGLVMGLALGYLPVALRMRR